MGHGYRGSEPSFKSLTFSPFIITRHSLGTGFTADWEGRQERAWPAINLSKLEMSRPTQPRRGARGALVSTAELPSRHHRPHIPHPWPPPLQMFVPTPRPPPTLLHLDASAWPFFFFPAEESCLFSNPMESCSQFGLCFNPHRPPNINMRERENMFMFYINSRHSLFHLFPFRGLKVETAL